mmetsp:Transcript_7584/g.17253  ORF Transcript_7584/g.17253 Transcript_7584/m.17253 type:complete len:235 (+) Transcript_7584:1084-1788(+)
MQQWMVRHVLLVLARFSLRLSGIFRWFLVHLFVNQAIYRKRGIGTSQDVLCRERPLSIVGNHQHAKSHIRLEFAREQPKLHFHIASLQGNLSIQNFACTRRQLIQSSLQDNFVVTFKQRNEIRFSQYLGRAEQFQQVLVHLDKLQSRIEETNANAANVLRCFIVPCCVFLQPPPFRRRKFQAEFFHQRNDLFSPMNNPLRKERVDFTGNRTAIQLPPFLILILTISLKLHFRHQ